MKYDSQQALRSVEITLLRISSRNTGSMRQSIASITIKDFVPDKDVETFRTQAEMKLRLIARLAAHADPHALFIGSEIRIPDPSDLSDEDLQFQAQHRISYVVSEMHGGGLAAFRALVHAVQPVLKWSIVDLSHPPRHKPIARMPLAILA